MRIAEALSWAAQLQSDSARLDVELLLAEALGKSRSYVFAWPERELSASEQAQFGAWFSRRLAGEPVAYILAKKGFWSLELEVSPCSLIPRPDTERLVEVALTSLPQEGALRVLDLGTGTGAIALALAYERPNARLVGVDVHADAVALARRNAAASGITNARFHQSDWFKQVDGQFDLIVSNPPYIAPDDPHLQQGDVRFEPASALVATEQGLACLRAIVTGAPNFLAAHGRLLLEHGWQQAPAVAELLGACGFIDVQSWRDLNGHPRVTGGVLGQ